MINVNKILDEAIEKDASDIHFIVENKAMLRIARNLVPAESSDVLTEENMNEIYDYCFDICNLGDKDKIFEASKKLGISFRLFKEFASESKKGTLIEIEKREKLNEKLNKQYYKPTRKIDYDYFRKEMNKKNQPVMNKSVKKETKFEDFFYDIDS